MKIKNYYSLQNKSFLKVGIKTVGNDQCDFIQFILETRTNQADLEQKIWK